MKKGQIYFLGFTFLELIPNSFLKAALKFEKLLYPKFENISVGVTSPDSNNNLAFNNLLC